jgi:hypothetical protein
MPYQAESFPNPFIPSRLTHTIKQMKKIGRNNHHHTKPFKDFVPNPHNHLAMKKQMGRGLTSITTPNTIDITTLRNNSTQKKIHLSWHPIIKKLPREGNHL